MQGINAAVESSTAVVRVKERAGCGRPIRFDNRTHALSWVHADDETPAWNCGLKVSAPAGPSPAESGVGGEADEADFTEAERMKAVRDIVTEWPYQRPSELMNADGDSIENIAVFLQMQLNRSRSALSQARAGEEKVGE